MSQSPAFCPTPGLSDKQRAIIEAATRIFLAAGYRETSMDAIAREAGVSKQTIYNHYGNKEALFSDVITQHCQDVLLSRLETEQARHDVEATLREFARTLLGIILQPSVLALHRLIIAESARFPEVGEIYYRVGPERGNRRLADYLDKQCAMKHLYIDNTYLAAQQFTGALIGSVRTQALVLNQAIPEAEIDSVVEHTVACFMALHGGKE
ncbi:MAG TPA: TetR/AcrR family transcriptional regulator [Gammaproteobacteria bacterium]|nr:TetR/AcrR family transcriptional regulator [Gammaproteobacteria bacterium]